jgi:hypothetical protein
MNDSIREKEKLIESLEQQIVDTLESIRRNPFDILDEFALWKCYVKLDTNVGTQIDMENMHPLLAYNVDGELRIRTFISIIRSFK